MTALKVWERKYSDISTRLGLVRAGEPSDRFLLDLRRVPCEQSFPLLNCCEQPDALIAIVPDGLSIRK
jgi:hypothetical protein